MESPRKSRIIWGILLLLAFLPWALAQQGGDGANAGRPGNGTTPRNVPPPTDIRIPQRPTPPPMFITGNVIQEDGTTPPFGAVIELSCGSSVMRKATVDVSGHFTLQVGDNSKPSDILPNASERYESSLDGGLASMSSSDSRFPSTMSRGETTPLLRLANCDLHAQLSGYRSSVLRLGGAPLTSANEVGTIVVYRMERARGTIVSAASLRAPKAAKKSMEQGKKAFQKEKYNESEAFFKSAITLYPNYGEAWLQLGQLYQRQQRNDEARNAYKKAIEIDNLHVNPYVQLGSLSAREKKWQEAADVTEQALALDPMTFPEAYCMNALANYNLNNLDLAEKRARQEQQLDPAHRCPQVHIILANIFSRKNDTPGSIEEMRKYLKYAPNAPDAAQVRSRLQEKEKLAKAK